MITRKQLADDYMTIKQITEYWPQMNRETVRRWIHKYFDKSKVEVMGAQYYVHKDEVERWKSAYTDSFPMRGKKVKKAA